jgi:peptide/nickel transport system substrate-binding protein
LINQIHKSIICNLCLSIFLSVVFTFPVKKAAFSQVMNNKYSQYLVVGELSGKVDPVDIWKLIEDKYYPLLSPNLNIRTEKIKDTKEEVAYKVIYPEGSFSNHPQQIIFKFYESENSLIAAIITEEVDFAITESYAAAEEVDKSTASFRVHFRYKNPNHVKMIAYNNQHYILKNAEIRQALTYAINRSYLLETILGRAAYLADGPLSRESRLHISVDEYKFNPRRALQILTQNNWYDSDGDGVLDKGGQPFQVSIIYERGVLLEEQLATRIKIDWNKIGIDVIRKPLEKSEIKKKLAAKNYDVILISKVFEETMGSFEKSFGSNGIENIFGYKSRRVYHFISLHKIQQDPNSKRLMLQAILKEINKDQPATFLFFLWVDRYFVNRKKFTNFQMRGQLLPFTEWELRNR